MLDRDGMISLILIYANEIHIDSDGFVALTTNDELMNVVIKEVNEQVTWLSGRDSQVPLSCEDIAKIVSILKQSLIQHGIVKQK